MAVFVGEALMSLVLGKASEGSRELRPANAGNHFVID